MSTKDSADTFDMPKIGPAKDKHGRYARDLRVSLTDRCNLRCTYCMPSEDVVWMDRTALLTDEEFRRLITIAVRDLAITNIRFTGGEPLLYRGLDGLIAHASSLRTVDGAVPGIALTTNGMGLAHAARRLADAGLQRINVSLDTTNPEHYEAITRRARLDDVFKGLDAARAAGLNPIKVNAVPRPETYREDAPALLRYCVDNGFQLRFIEHMPIGASLQWDETTIVTKHDLMVALTEAGAELRVPKTRRGAAPAELFDVTIDGKTGSVGVIASVTAAFCGACDRTRLTSDGQIRSCLFGQQEVDVRAALRSGASDAEIEKMWRTAMWHKPRAHGIEHEGFARPVRSMSAMGG